MKDFALIKLHDNLTHFKQELALNPVNEVLPAIIHKISKTPPFYFKIGKGPLEITSKKAQSYCTGCQHCPGLRRVFKIDLFGEYFLDDCRCGACLMRLFQFCSTLLRRLFEGSAYSKATVRLVITVWYVC